MPYNKRLAIMAQVHTESRYVMNKTWRHRKTGKIDWRSSRPPCHHQWDPPEILLYIDIRSVIQI